MTPVGAGVFVQLPKRADVINVGLPLFEDSLKAQSVAVVGTEWRIPGRGKESVVAALARLWGPKSKLIETANAEVLSRLNRGRPMLRAIERAGAVIPEMSERTLLHCGPAIRWSEMCDPLRRSLTAAVVVEGWAQNAEDAACLLAADSVELKPANEHSAVLPMATVIGPSTPVYVVENDIGSTRAYSSINQGAGAVQWFGVNSAAAVERLAFIRDTIGPILAETLRRSGPIDILSLVAQGVLMGDDVHLRVQATTNLLLKELLPFLVQSQHGRLADVAEFLSRNHMMFLNVAMAAAKSLVDAAATVQNASIVTTMARNGTSYGIRLAGVSDRWFLASAPSVQDALYYPGFGPEVSARDIGDSAVLELVGLGGAAAANSPAVAAILGGRMADARSATERMRRICAGESTRFRMPFLENAGTPVGVDVRRVVEFSITPGVSTGIIHATDGVGQIGAGVAWAPLKCFTDALLELDARIV